MADYIALIHKEPDSDYGVSFPDFPGCITAGATLDEAKVLATEALAFHVEGLIEDGEPIPIPSSLDDVMTDRAHRDAVAFLVSLPEPAKTVRVNITMSDRDLAEIDAAAKARGMTRSAYLVEAAKRAAA
ncbi:type II toxin-antitoxin system HicB family antitoxin [Arenibaculum sp.]|jgi:predicted RNase H-like HicB family nuclease|uniref:type II toxin-antitoxin system HicB family antitoxin n=1 Tax=Arenibaculum sp. TaxID=2865862 RepID=UPI002E0D3AB4|nr:type II toxin-antitoxin system HicB family antitoxin [Kaistia sp.]HEV7372075.1 type II toxin-antitoxin system HicB family antitoxin [Arenibaculum sp.]